MEAGVWLDCPSVVHKDAQVVTILFVADALSMPATSSIGSLHRPWALGLKTRLMYVAPSC